MAFVVINRLRDHQIIDLSKLKAFADNYFSVAQMEHFFSLIEKKTLLVTIILSFPKMFPKRLFLGSLKVGLVW